MIQIILYSLLKVMLERKVLWRGFCILPIFSTIPENPVFSTWCYVLCCCFFSKM